MTAHRPAPSSRAAFGSGRLDRLLVARRPVGSLLPERLPARIKNIRSLPEARRALRRGTLCGAVVESGFDAGHGLAFALELRKHFPLSPILFVEEEIRAQELVWAHEARIAVVTSKCPEEDIVRFVRGMGSAPPPTFDSLKIQVEHFAREHGLTPREARIVRALADGCGREEMLKAFGVTANTLKTQARSLLKKTQLKSLHAVTRAVLTQVIVGSAIDSERAPSSGI